MKKILNDKDDIRKCSLIEKIYIEKHKRWYAKLDPRFNGKRNIPYANYIWLKHNPVFVDIPNGYVVHHLDGDKTNDDPSNLALILHHLHVVHHWKNRDGKVEPPKFRVIPSETCSDDFMPKKEPQVKFNPDRGVFYLFYYDLEGKRRYISHDNGSPLLTMEQAENLRDKFMQNLSKLEQSGLN